MDEQEIEKRIDRTVANVIPVSEAVGGVKLTTMGEIFEFAKMMAVAAVAVPKHLRGQPGTCLAICIQAFEWRMSPFAVANKSYSVNDRLAYESQLVHAVVEARAPLEKRLRDTFKGEGQERQCTISGTLKGDATPFEITSPMLKDIKVKNSPLWTSDPDQQLFYYTTRAWARRYVPDVLLGIYTKEEIEEIGEGPGGAVDVTPGAPSELAQRIAGGKGTERGRGFDADAIDRTLGITHQPGEGVPAAGVKEPAGAEIAEERPKGKRKTKPAEVTDVETGEPRSGSAAAASTAGDGKSEGVPTGAGSIPASPSNEEAKSDTPTANGGGQGEAIGELTEAAATKPAENITEIITDPPNLVETMAENIREPVETEAQRYAQELIEKIAAHLKSSDAPQTVEDLRAYKAEMRKTIDGLELSSDDTDLLRGRFTLLMLETEKALSKKKGGKR